MDPALSIYFDLIRFGAAVIVVLNHYGVLLGLARQSTFPGSDAVIVFFVLSGYVIAFVSDRPTLTARHYALDRLSRLWSVAMPAAALALVIGVIAVGFSIHLGPYGTRSPKELIVGVLVNVGFFGESWSQTYAPYNFPFWSVNYEAWYYAIFGFWLFSSGAYRYSLPMIGCLLAGPSIMAFFPIWLLGVGLYRRRATLKVTNKTAVALFVASIIGYAVIYHFDLNLLSRLWLKTLTRGESYRLGPSTSIIAAYLIALVVAANFVAVTNMRRSKTLLAPLRKFARTVSSYTLTLYLFHMPLYFAFKLVGINMVDLRGKLSVFVLLGLFVAVLGPLTEHRRLAWRNGLATILAPKKFNV